MAGHHRYARRGHAVRGAGGGVGVALRRRGGDHITAVDTFLGAVLCISTAQYHKENKLEV